MPVSPLFIKTHFETVANVIKLELSKHDSTEEDVLDSLIGIAEQFCTTFLEYNPRFDKDRFLKACGF